MDKQEAKLVLQACRSNGQDAALPVFAEALALAERDPELKAWWEAQQSFDRKVAAKLDQVLVPGDLRAVILAGRKIEQLTPRSHYPYWLAAAAVVAVLVIAGSLFQRMSVTAPPITSIAYSHGAIADLAPGTPPLEMLSPDHDKINSWLVHQNAPTGHLPPSMTSLPTVGCQKFAVEGHNVSLICFSLVGGGVVHLFVINRRALTDPPSQTAPEFNRIGEWSTAAWSDDTQSYLLVTDGGEDQLKQLL